jgi:succinate dehydrogenase / fumarate reductase cytochrome b subunit
MALSGLVLAGFILGHMIGNLPLLIPGNQDAYNWYAHLLTGNKNILYAIEAFLGIVLIVHFWTSITLKLENKKARGPVGYAVQAYAGDTTGTKRSFATFTMIYSGIWILGYLIFHIFNLKFGTYYTTMVNGLEIRDMYKTTMEEFAKPYWAALYTVSMGVLAMHLTHAIKSVFQTLGLNHSRWNSLINLAANLYVIVVAGGFAVIAVGAYLIGRSLS